VPFVDAHFLEWGEVFEDVIGVSDGLAFLSHKRIVIFFSHCAL